jgi:transcriptional antiterminator RfaH
MIRDDRRWYVLQCKPREVFRAVEQLANQDYEAFAPSFRREAIRKGKREVVVEPLFPHYCFVRLSDIADNWAPIRSTRGRPHWIIRFRSRKRSLCRAKR